MLIGSELSISAFCTIDQVALGFSQFDFLLLHCNNETYPKNDNCCHAGVSGSMCWMVWLRLTTPSTSSIFVAVRVEQLATAAPPELWKSIRRDGEYQIESIWYQFLVEIAVVRATPVTKSSRRGSFQLGVDRCFRGRCWKGDCALDERIGAYSGFYATSMSRSRCYSTSFFTNLPTFLWLWQYTLV